jgi:hypothetical protein
MEKKEKISFYEEPDFFSFEVKKHHSLCIESPSWM